MSSDRLEELRARLSDLQQGLAATKTKMRMASIREYMNLQNAVASYQLEIAEVRDEINRLISDR